MRVNTDIRQSKRYGEYMELLGWNVIKITENGKQVTVFVKKIGPAAIAKIQRVRLPLPWDKVNKVLKENRVVYTRLEPLDCKWDINELKKQGYKKEKEPLRATKTLLIDLTPDEKTIMAGFKRARSWIRKIPKQKIELNNFELFYEIWRKATNFQKIWCSSFSDYKKIIDSFGDDVFCLTIDRICGVLILTYDSVAYYYYAAALTEAKELNLPYLITWEAIREAKRRGCKIWDFEGIFDPRYPNPKWAGFSQFKKTFGGEVVDLPGSFSRTSLGNFFHR